MLLILLVLMTCFGSNICLLHGTRACSAPVTMASPSDTGGAAGAVGGGATGGSSDGASTSQAQSSGS